MQEPRAFKLAEGVLDTDTVAADRFVYAPLFVAYDPFADDDVGALPLHQLESLAHYVALFPESSIRNELIRKYEGLAKQIGDVEERLAQFEELGPQQPPPEVIERVRDEIVEFSDTLARAWAADDRDAVEEMMSRLGLVAERASVLTTSPATSTTTPPPGAPARASSVPTDEQLLATARTELGFLFLDRTRIRQVGFALGEHVHSLSLAPGEEVTIEERTFSKRESSLEDITDQERTFDTELSSTLTTELTEGLDRENTRTIVDTDTMGFNVGGNIYGITFNVGPTSTSNLTDADRISSRRSIKDTQVSASKVAGRYRSQHKIVFKVSTESRFETTSHRTISNPNANTPIDLEYFKVMQRLALSQERYGARLCWAPAIGDPGAAFFARVEKVRRQIYADAEKATSGPRPVPPVTTGTVTVPPRNISQSVVADKWDPVWGNQSFDYIVQIPAPPGMEWDPSVSALVFNFTGNRPAAADVVARLPMASGVTFVVHVGIEDCQNPFKPQFFEAVGSASFTVTARFRALPAAGSTDAERKALEDWRHQVELWEAAEHRAKTDAKAAADQAWSAYIQQVAPNTNPIHETIAEIIRLKFPAYRRDEVWEVDLWERIFDFRNAALRLYPSWWSTRDVRDPDRSPYDFVNASWARLYLPIQPGAEVEALRWIYARTIGFVASPTVETMIAKVVKELTAYRTHHFGGDDELTLDTASSDDCQPTEESFRCLARWNELLPTDGTHIEVLQSTTSAADDISVSSLEDASRLRELHLARSERENALLEKAEQNGLGSLETEIRVNVGPEPPS